MCGIAGILNLVDRVSPDDSLIREMLRMLHHRGPDGYGTYRDSCVGLGSARLSIIDILGGDQPIGSEDNTLWIIYNGEVFNYLELRTQLEDRGHTFRTQTDTEVILHLYEDHGPSCLQYLNGQFAFAIWNERTRTLFLARDRMGIRPLFYTVHDGHLLFGSEVKSFIAYPGFRFDIDPVSLQQVFTYWSVQPPRTIFQNIFELPPAHYLLAKDGQFEIYPYWSLDFSEEQPARQVSEYLDELESLLADATRLRLRADVPVGAYLSGGLDSSLIAALIHRQTSSDLHTFSITFSDPAFDESHYQEQVAAALGTTHHVVHASYRQIADAFPDVVWHTETPLLRAAPAPMFLLSKYVSGSHIKVVLTGEGADEILAGYDIFKEMKIRRFWARLPKSKLRPKLLSRLYPYIPEYQSAAPYLKAFYQKGLEEVSSPYYSHSIRWSNTARTKRFLSQGVKEVGMVDPCIEDLPGGFFGWSDLAKAQYLEMTTFLSPYLLSSQGDRMAMGHSVEGRFPFLDYRVVEFCNRLPQNLKLYGLVEKWLLKQLGRRLVPKEIWSRTKQPYRSPIQNSFFSKEAPSYVRDLLSDGALQENGYFEPEAVLSLAAKSTSGRRISEMEEMALMGILSTQLVHEQFVKPAKQRTAVHGLPGKVVDHVELEP